MTTPEDSENDSESPELESENGSQSDLEVASEPWKLRCERLEQRVCCTPWVFLQFLNPTENEDQEAVDRHTVFHPAEIILIDTDSGSDVSLKAMIDQILIIWQVRLWRQFGYWNNPNRHDIVVISQVAGKKDPMEALIWPILERASDQVKKEQVGRVRESAPILRNMSGDEIENFLKDLAKRLVGED